MDGEEFKSDRPLESSRRALRHRVVQRLLTKIFRGEFGPGTRLISNSLAFQLGVSATPVREALVELEQSGFVQLVHHRGAVVRPFGRAELRDFYHVRSLLQCGAVRLACGNVDVAHVNALHDDLQRLNGGSQEHGRYLKDILAVDQRIRQMLVDCCPNKRLSAELCRHESIELALREVVESGRLRDCEALLPAADLVAALQKGQARQSARAMRRHVRVLAAEVESVVVDSRP